MVLDSDVLIDYLRGREPIKTKLLELFPSGRLCTTVVNQFELLAGSRQTSTQLQVIEDLLSVLPILRLDPESASIAAEMKRNLAVSGNEIGMADCLIAGVAMAHGLPLLTRNRRHFVRIPQLELIRFEDGLT